MIGVQTSKLPSMKAALEQHEPVTVPATKTIADGIAVRRAGDITFPLVQKYVDDIVTVDDEEIANAILLLLEKEKTLTEGAGAVAAAAVLNIKFRYRGKKWECSISGGNIDVTLLSRIIERGLVKDGRLLRIRIHLPDHPGALQRLATVIADHKANIIETLHDRAYYGVVLGDTVIDITMETRGPEHIAELEGGARCGRLRARARPVDRSNEAGCNAQIRHYCCCCCCCCLLGGLLGALGDGGGGAAPTVSRNSLAAGVIERRAHADVDREALAGVAFVNAAHRSDIAIIAAVGDADVAQADGLCRAWDRIPVQPALGMRTSAQACEAWPPITSSCFASAESRCREPDSRRRSAPESRACAPRRAAGGRNPGRRPRRATANPRWTSARAWRPSRSENARESSPTRPAQSRPPFRRWSLLGAGDDFLELGEVRDVGGGRHEIEILLVELVAVRIEIRRAWCCRRAARRDRAPARRIPPRRAGAVLGKHVELMHPVAVGVAIGRAARTGIGGEAEREAALPLVVHRTQADFVVAFRNRTVVDEIPSCAPDDIDSCHHRVVEVGSGDIFSNRAAHSQQIHSDSCADPA